MWIYQGKTSPQEAAVQTLAENHSSDPGVYSKQHSVQQTDPVQENRPDSSQPPSTGTISKSILLQPRVSVRRSRRGGQATRNCLMLAGAYLFGAFLSGVLRAAMQAKELTLMNQYLENWSEMFVLNEPEAVLRLFISQYLSVVGAVTILLALGLSAFGPVMIYLFTMLYGLGVGMMGLELFLQLSWKRFAAYLLLVGLPAAAVAVCLCLFGALALEVSSRLQHSLFDRNGTVQPMGVGSLLGEYLMFDLILLPVCGTATALTYLANHLPFV